MSSFSINQIISGSSKQVTVSPGSRNQLTQCWERRVQLRQQV